MKALLLAAATMAAVSCASEPAAAVRVPAHTLSGDGAVEPATGSAAPSPGSTSTTTEPETTTTAAPEPTTTEAPYVAPVTTRATTTTVYDEPHPQAHTTRGDVWSDLADCESGSQNVDTGNGYSGYFQFSDGTWRSMGTGYARAVDASYDVQLAAAQRLQARSGWGQWPACSRKLGLR